MTEPIVLDVCCGPKSFYFDKSDERVLFLDKRRVSYAGLWKDSPKSTVNISPDMQADFTDLPIADSSFSLIVFDPPHLRHAGEESYLAKKYGVLPADWQDELRKGFSECFRVLKPSGTLIFKWNETQIPLKDILALTDHSPLFGHRSGKRSLTHWVAFIKGENND